MSKFKSTKAKRALAAPLRIGWAVKRQSGSHRTLSRDGWADVVLPFTTMTKSDPKCFHALPK